MHLIPLCVVSASSACLVALAQEPAFLAPPQHAAPPLARHAVTNRAFTGISSLAVAPGGRLWVAWYAGKTPGEDQNNYVVLSTSGDSGKTWREVLVVDPDGDGPVRTFDPELWMGPDGRLRLFWAQASGHDLKVGGVWSMTAAEPDSAEAAWQPPVRLTDGVMMCKPLALSTGEWVLPAATWHVDGSARMAVSSDQGRSWSVRGACNVPKDARNCDEHMFVERKDGSLWLLVRTKYGIGESVSTDRGKTWPELTPSSIAHTTSRFFITRLASGNLLLVKHGPLGTRAGRSHLTAFVSKDDGKSWEGGLLLDERNGVSYPDGQQAADGTVYITYDYSRTDARHILFAAFREADAAAGKEVSGAVRLRQLVSEGSGGLEKTKPAAEANADGAPLATKPAGALAADGAQAAPLTVGAKLFSDRAYTCAEVPAALKGARFLCVPMNGAKTLRCTRAGTVYFLTPAPARNPDSVTPALLEQGFKKAALPEVRLFAPASPANFCTLYQKSCAEGERVTIGKWALPLFLSE